MYVHLYLQSLQNEEQGAGVCCARGRNEKHDIDVCVVTETHLKLDQPDAVVNSEDFNIYIYIYIYIYI